ncbi:MAG: thiol:disulfide interchange protein DsbA/DsbL [Steroidobacteraceae bacterium]
MPLLPLRLFTLSAALLLALCACARQSQAPRQTAQAAAQTDQTTAPAAASGQQAASAQAAAAPSSPAGGAQAADASSPSLEHLAGLSTSGGLPSSDQWKPGVNYDVISPAQPTTVAPGKVEVLEVFWLACPHCFALEPYLDQWRKTKPAYVQFVRVPVMWGPVHRAHARLFYTLEALGRDDLVDKAFRYLHNMESQSGSEDVLFSNSKNQTFKQQQAWAVQNGINADAFAKAYNSFYVNTQLQQADEITNAYQVQGVPFIAVDGKFTTDVGKASGGDDPSKLISLINFLAAWEHDHNQG